MNGINGICKNCLEYKCICKYYNYCDECGGHCDGVHSRSKNIEDEVNNIIKTLVSDKKRFELVIKKLKEMNLI